MKDKVVIITGASSGIGKALAECFGLAGSKLLITGRNLENLLNTQKELSSKNISCHILQGSVDDENHHKELVAYALRHFGKIDILINNAGISMRALFEEVDTDVIKKLMDTNFFGAVYATKACLPEILCSKGSIVGISSIAGFRGLPARTGYSASKFALQGFLESLRSELLYRGVHILIACPGFTASNIRRTSLSKDGTPQGESPRKEEKMMSAEECAKHIYKAVQNRKNYLILTTQGKLAVFLNKWLPSFMDKMVYKLLAKEKNAPFQSNFQSNFQSKS